MVSIMAIAIGLSWGILEPDSVHLAAVQVILELLSHQVRIPEPIITPGDFVFSGQVTDSLPADA